MSKQTYNVGKMKLFINKRKPMVQPIIIKKEASIEEQRKELLYWESQYEKLFDIIEKKKTV